MTVNVRAGLVSTKELEDMQREGNLKLLTSKQLANIPTNPLFAILIL